MMERNDRVNWSTLKNILTSPKHYRWALDHPREDTEALLRGRATHCAIYEPSEYGKRYVVAPKFHRGMLDKTAREKGYEGGKEAAAQWDAQHRDAEVLTPEMNADVIGMATATKDDPIAGPMIEGGFAEQAVTWTDALTGIECRGRVDHINGRLSDLKTTRNIDPRAFGRDVARFMYHGQLAYYADGLAANGIVLEGEPAIIAVENTAPYDVLVLTFSEEDMAAGRALYRKALDCLSRSRELDEWPGVSGGEPMRVPLPAWVMPEAEEITLGGVRLF